MIASAGDRETKPDRDTHEEHEECAHHAEIIGRTPQID